MKKIIGLTGYHGSGKTSVANILNEYFPGNFMIIHLADKLKEEASDFFNIPRDVFYSPTKKDKVLSLPVEPADRISHAICDGIGANRYFTPRDLLVAYGAFRRFYRPTYWLDEVIGKWEGNEILLVPDIRYRNEYNYLRDIGGKLIRVERTDIKRRRNDPSETEQESFSPDWLVISPPGLDKLEDTMADIELPEKIFKEFK